MQCSISGYYGLHLGESTKLAQCRKSSRQLNHSSVLIYQMKD